MTFTNPTILSKQPATASFTGGIRDAQLIRSFLLLSLFNIGVFATLLLIHRGNPTYHHLAVMDSILLICFSGNLLAAPIFKKIKISTIISLVLLATTFIYLFATGGYHNTGIYWCILFPLAASYLMGANIGTIAAIIILIPYILLQLFAPQFDIIAVYDHAILLRGFIIYILITAFSYDFIRSREQYEKELHKTQESLQDLVAQQTAELKRANLSLKNDIAKRIEAEKALKKSEHEYRTLLESVSDYIFTHDLKGNILESNFHFKAEPGYSKEDFATANLKEFIVESRPNSFKNYLEDIIKNKENNGLLTIQTKEGAKRIFEYRNVLVPKEGQNQVVRGVAIDITEKGELENHLLTAEKMKALGTLARGIAHDFNNILSAIRGYTELIRAKDSTKEEVYEYNDQIIIASEKATGLVQQILTFSRQSKSENSSIQLSKIIEETVKLLIPSLPPSITITQHISSHALVFADETKLHQIIMNLCTNSYHAMKETGGTLEIELQETTMNFAEIAPTMPGGKYLRLRIIDMGHGMSEETMEHIFDPYFTTKPQEQGTGLGLAVVMGIIQEFKGHITVSSTLGEGSTFTVYLPINHSGTSIP